ncbi:SDR family NAD(P)-dependent oxidoreductase [uncultured Draconibacterium sp.]|uniref:SDR family NAD(P)-dependent oxidoreductase n=1 Tax=uncultured Draconibacterium sp. TaxID=1573823 RepID=UPI0025EEA90A|nr:SDR family NAD(P)-dependent oxidoreductase [uncultured Draconibacterium sp.]
MNKLIGKNAFITGTSQGIGAAISKLLIEEGCNVCMHYFSSNEEPMRLKKIAEDNGQKAICLQADLTNEQEAKKCISEAVKAMGTFDVLINNSGSLVKRSFVGDIEMDYWQKLIDINLTTMMLVTREIIPHLNSEEGSSIVNVASLAGRVGGHPGSLVYSMCKGAVLTWSRALAKEVAPQGIRVNSVAPGFIQGTAFHATHTTEESAKKTIEGIPLQRSGNPDDVARAVAFLASEYDGFITGETLDINGGVYSA